MNEKEKYSRNNSLLRQSIDEQDQFPSSTLNHQSDLFSNHQQLTYNQNILPIPTTVSRKRSIQSDYSIQESAQQVRE